MAGLRTVTLQLRTPGSAWTGWGHWWSGLGKEGTVSAELRTQGPAALGVTWATLREQLCPHLHGPLQSPDTPPAQCRVGPEATGDPFWSPVGRMDGSSSFSNKAVKKSMVFSAWHFLPLCFPRIPPSYLLSPDSCTLCLFVDLHHHITLQWEC